MKPMDHFLQGGDLYGDGFDQTEIMQWYEREAEAYASLGARDVTQYQYVYHALNDLCGFQFLQSHCFPRVLGLGSAYGHEFLPIQSMLGEVHIVDSSESFENSPLSELHITYHYPNITGTLVFPSDYFDLVTCFGVLHHIPNVSHVLSELYRCLNVGGVALIREPVVSMGDWRHPRPGLTNQERGLPSAWFKRKLNAIGFNIISEKYCLFAPLAKVGRWLKRPMYNDTFLTQLDLLLSRLTSRYRLPRYHATHFLQKVQATNVYYVLKK